MVLALLVGSISKPSSSSSLEPDRPCQKGPRAEGPDSKPFQLKCGLLLFPQNLVGGVCTLTPISSGYFGGGRAGGGRGDGFPDPVRSGIAMGADGLGCDEEVVDEGYEVGDRGAGLFDRRREWLETYMDGVSDTSMPVTGFVYCQASGTVECRVRCSRIAENGWLSVSRAEREEWQKVVCRCRLCAKVSATTSGHDRLYRMEVMIMATEEQGEEEVMVIQQQTM